MLQLEPLVYWDAHTFFLPYTRRAMRRYRQLSGLSTSRGEARATLARCLFRKITREEFQQSVVNRLPSDITWSVVEQALLRPCGANSDSDK